ncbi:Bacterial type II and III secretion system protein [Shewanella psychrophila]|uniref:Bacterial type II and III secretion system protein n=1 Tax=Shewanella psychrophila TaxID=225848 RepID=A0A1S6HWH0_9GAMM|nr:hypothetical protein [Shewanella psychrophila]AQS39917.1 Bacterial type II and III secretion system protein [Shewanella psychrophila]
MKVNKLLLFFAATVLLSGCAEMSSFSQGGDEIESRRVEMEKQFSDFKISDDNFLELQDNSSYPNKFWALNIKTTYFKSVSIDEVLKSLGQKLNVSYFDKGDDSEQTRKIIFEGSVNNYLKYLADAYDVFIDVDKYKIVKRNYKTKVFKLYNSRYLKNESKYAFGSSIVDSKGGANGFSGEIAIGGAVDLWGEANEYLTSMKESNESFNYSIFRDFSQIVATGSKKELDRVELFVDNYNKLASTEIKISYKIISINQESLKALGADLQGGDSAFQINGSTSSGYGGLELGSVSVGAAVDGSTDTIGGSLTAQLVKSGARIMNEGVAVSLNGKPVPINAVNEVGYVSTITREPGSENEDAAETIETDTLETGMSFMIVPDVLNDGRVNITMGYSRKRLNQLVSFGAEGDSVQLPNISRNENINNLIVGVGKETVVAIFKEDLTSKADYTGLVGKSMSDSNSKSVTALIVRVDTKT